jgi:hypothetical protein
MIYNFKETNLAALANTDEKVSLRNRKLPESFEAVRFAIFVKQQVGYIHLLISIWIMLLPFFGCKKNNPTPNSPSPSITSINPTSGVAGATITIAGSNFDVTPANNTVKFNGTNAVVNSATGSTLTVTAPAGGSSGAVTVSTSAGTATGPVFTYNVTVASDVYVAGFELSSSGHPTAKYWKNGAMTALSDGSKDTYAESIFVSGSDIYVAGYGWKGPAGPGNKDVAKYWKNGILVDLTDGTKQAQAYSVYVSGSDFYVAGYETETSGDINAAAKYWKNGSAVTFTRGSNTAQAIAVSVFVSGTDVYAAGYEYNYYPAESVWRYAGVYWKNGIETPLFKGVSNSSSVDAVATSIFVVGSDVYVTGYVGVAGLSNAVYFKNGTATPLTDGSQSSQGNCVFVSGSDVYVAGYESNGTFGIAKFWKNGTSNSLTDGTVDALANSVYVSGSDVYTAGQIYHGNQINIATYWKNTTAFALTDGTYNASALSVFVK